MFTGLGVIVAGLPLAVLGNAMGPYDDPKAWALPILVALTGLGWIASGRRPVEPADTTDRGARVLRWILLAGLGWSMITTLTSVAPAQSVLGTFGRGVGLLTVGSATLLFFLTRSECRTPETVRRLIDVTILGSAPVCLLALGQAMGWDPLPKPWDPAVTALTVRSTFGSHIFLGSYLALLIPLTAARLESAFRRWRAGDAAARPRGAIVGALLGGLLVAQVLVVVLSRGRGGLIGMLVGLSATSFVFLIRSRAWKTLTIAGVALAAVIAFIVLLNWPGSPVAALGKTRLLGRLGDIANLERGSPSAVRLEVWRGLADGWIRQLRGEEVVPGRSPRVRSVIGYGLETQLLVLEPMTYRFVGVYHAGGDRWRANYVFDRAHSVVLDRLVTEGFVGAALWTAFAVGVLVVGWSRLRTGAGPAEPALRIGALGAVLGHAADGLVGIATPTTLALFFVAAALLVCGPTRPSAGPVAARRGARARWRIAAVGAGLLLVVAVAWINTRWLLASIAYADGVRHGIAGRLDDAYRDFQRSLSLTPWLPLPAEAVAYAGLRMAAAERDPLRRLQMLSAAETTVAEARRHAMGGAGSWALTAQIGFAEARAGDDRGLAVSRDAFAAALRLRPGDVKLLTQSALIWLESGDAPRARQLAEQALARDSGEWLAWAVLARASKRLGNDPEAQDAAARARALVPPEARRVLDDVLR